MSFQALIQTNMKSILFHVFMTCKCGIDSSAISKLCDKADDG